MRVVAIAAGGDHSMVLTNEGEVLSFGSGCNRKLGHGDYKDQLEPMVIACEALRGVRVVAIAAGFHHSVMLHAAHFPCPLVLLRT